MSEPRILFAAPGSGSGKTTITCGVLKALKNRGKKVASFKCGPDYIDPMFQEQVIGVRSGNLDLFFSDPQTLRRLFRRNAAGAEISVIEGVMGYYDGLGAAADEASTYRVAETLKAPVVLIVDARGQSLSALATLQGFLRFREDSLIRGVIFNRMSGHVYNALKDEVEKQGVHPLGYLPKVPELTIESRHLGLVTPGEIEDLSERLQELAKTLEETLDMDALIRLAEEAEPLEMLADPEEAEPKGARIVMERAEQPDTFPEHVDIPRTVDGKTDIEAAASAPGGVKRNGLLPLPAKVKIAAAKDEAFCFYYKDNLHLLEQLGAELLYFSPIHDEQIPEGAQGMILPGGYPELYAEALSENTSMKESVTAAIRGGLPCLAECGGFLYLHRELTDMNGVSWPMCGVIDAKAWKTSRLGRFGYITLTSNTDNELLPRGEEIRAHEFHYFESGDCGSDLHAEKPSGGRSWDCTHIQGNLVAGFPHLFYESNPQFIARFLRRCAGEE